MSMAITAQLSASVIECARTVERSGRMVERQQGGQWVAVPLGEVGEDLPSERTIAWMKDRGLLTNSGSGAGRGLKIDSEVAAAMGMPEFDDS